MPPVAGGRTAVWHSSCCNVRMAILARLLPTLLATAFTAAAGIPAVALDVEGASADLLPTLRPYVGVYRLGGENRLGIERFVADGGEATLLFSDYHTGLVRPLFRVEEDEFALGPTFAVRSPI